MGRHELCDHHDHDHHDNADLPPCLMPCMDVIPEGYEPTCGDFEHLVGPGGCASTCDNATLGMVYYELCESDDHDHHGHDDHHAHHGDEGHPECADKCKDAIPENCEP